LVKPAPPEIAPFTVRVTPASTSNVPPPFIVRARVMAVVCVMFSVPPSKVSAPVPRLLLDEMLSVPAEIVVPPE
jgi:hypothetical protein